MEEVLGFQVLHQSVADDGFQYLAYRNYASQGPVCWENTCAKYLSVEACELGRQCISVSWSIR
jgi:hypothetical protein